MNHVKYNCIDAYMAINTANVKMALDTLDEFVDNDNVGIYLFLRQMLYKTFIIGVCINLKASG